MIKIETEQQPEYLKILNDLDQDGMHFIQAHDFWIAAHFDHMQWKGNLVVFQDCNFQGHLYMTNIDLGPGVLFERCTFQYGLTLDNCTSGEHSTILADGSPFAASFSQCKINNQFIVKSCHFRNDILIHRQSTVANVELSDTQLSGIRIHNSTIQGFMEIVNLQMTGFFLAGSVEFMKPVKIKNCAADFNVSSCIFHEQFTLQTSVLKVFYSSELDYKSEFEIFNCQVATIFALNDSNFEKTAMISNALGVDHPIVT